MSPLFSVVIPGYNRPEPLKHTLRSVAAAAYGVGEGGVETILVDDGSAPSLEKQLAGFETCVEIHHLRQPNQGSIIARLTGLHAATGKFVLFLDSDDLIHPEKLLRHLAAHRTHQTDIVYDDMAIATLQADHDSLFSDGERVLTTNDVPDFFLRAQPAPHCPSYRRAYLTAALNAPIVPLDRRMDPAGDIWLYYNLLCHPAKIVKVDQHLTAVGPHPNERFSQHWETLGAAALLVAEGFQRRRPSTPSTIHAGALVGAVAFESWRRLPHDFHHGFSERLLAVWRNSPKGTEINLGGPVFRGLSLVLGPVNAGRLLRRLRGKPYATCRTFTTLELKRMLAAYGL